MERMSLTATKKLSSGNCLSVDVDATVENRPVFTLTYGSEPSTEDKREARLLVEAALRKYAILSREQIMAAYPEKIWPA